MAIEMCAYKQAHNFKDSARWQRLPLQTKMVNGLERMRFERCEANTKPMNAPNPA